MMESDFGEERSFVNYTAKHQSEMSRRLVVALADILFASVSVVLQVTITDGCDCDSLLLLLVDSRPFQVQLMAKLVCVVV